MFETHAHFDEVIWCHQKACTPLQRLAWFGCARLFTPQLSASSQVPACTPQQRADAFAIDFGSNKDEYRQMHSLEMLVRPMQNLSFDRGARDRYTKSFLVYTL